MILGALAVLPQLESAALPADAIEVGRIADAWGIKGWFKALKGARVFISRSSFPSTADGEYYWVDLLGLDVVNREGVALGQVKDLMSTGPQTVLVLSGAPADGDKPVERMIPFVAAFIDDVDLPARKITVDWQADY